MGKFIDLRECRFGFWFVLDKAEKSKSNKTQWLCECDCGTQKVVTSNSLRTCNSTSCGCNHAPNLVDKEFGELKVLRLDESKVKGRRYWICKCSCENEVSISTYHLRNNIVSSCGHENSNIISIDKNKIKDCQTESGLIDCFLWHYKKQNSSS
jgi:hypothetical protein